MKKPIERFLDHAPPDQAGVLRRLSARIERIVAPNPGPFTFGGTGVYLVGPPAGPVMVIDPGPDLPGHLEALGRAIAGRGVSHILVTHTHRDHSPAAQPLKKLTGAKTYGYGPHEDPEGGAESTDRAFVPDVHVRDGDLLQGAGLAVSCVFTPGHTANHMCYALAQEAALFTGDHVMGWSTSVIAPPDGNMAAYMQSLEKLIARDDAILYPTHGAPIAGPKAFLRALLTHRRLREAQIKRIIAQGADTRAAIVARLYRDVAPALHKAAALTTQAHLDKLEAEGRIESLPGGRYRVAASLAR